MIQSSIIVPHLQDYNKFIFSHNILLIPHNKFIRCSNNFCAMTLHSLAFFSHNSGRTNALVINLLIVIAVVAVIVLVK